MIGYSLSHWGIVLIPDDANRQNVQFNQGGSIDPLEPGEPLRIQSIYTGFAGHQHAPSSIAFVARTARRIGYRINNGSDWLD